MYWRVQASKFARVEIGIEKRKCLTLKVTAILRNVNGRAFSKFHIRTYKQLFFDKAQGSMTQSFVR